VGTVEVTEGVGVSDAGGGVAVGEGVMLGEGAVPPELLTVTITLLTLV
jgi:hypothetical protein